MSDKTVREVYRYLLVGMDTPLPSEQVKLEKIARLLDSMLIGRRPIISWLFDPRPDFDGRSPQTMIQSGQVDKVLDLVEAWAEGNFG
jgi:hypothetical protein